MGPPVSKQARAHHKPISWSRISFLKRKWKHLRLDVGHDPTCVVLCQHKPSPTQPNPTHSIQLLGQMSGAGKPTCMIQQNREHKVSSVVSHSALIHLPDFLFTTFIAYAGDFFFPVYTDFFLPACPVFDPASIGSILCALGTCLSPKNKTERGIHSPNLSQTRLGMGTEAFGNLEPLFFFLRKI